MARFPQLDRLAESEEWVDWRRGEHKSRGRRNMRGPRSNRDIPLYELINNDGVVPETEDN